MLSSIIIFFFEYLFWEDIVKNLGKQSTQRNKERKVHMNHLEDQLKTQHMSQGKNTQWFLKIMIKHYTTKTMTTWLSSQLSSLQALLSLQSPTKWTPNNKDRPAVNLPSSVYALAFPNLYHSQLFDKSVKSWSQREPWFPEALFQN